MPRPCGACQKVFLTSSQTRPTALGSRLKRLRLAAAHSLRSHVCEPSLPSTGRENMRFCRAEMPSYYVKALENTQSILCGLFLVCEHFCSGRTCFASDSLGFSRDFCSFGRRRAVARQGQKGKRTEKDWLSDAWVSCPSMADFCRRTRRRQKCFTLYLRLRAQTLRGFFRRAVQGGAGVPRPAFFVHPLGLSCNRRGSALYCIRKIMLLKGVPVEFLR